MFGSFLMAPVTNVVQTLAMKRWASNWADIWEEQEHVESLGGCAGTRRREDEGAERFCNYSTKWRVQTRTPSGQNWITSETTDKSHCWHLVCLGSQYFVSSIYYQICHASLSQNNDNKPLIKCLHAEIPKSWTHGGKNSCVTWNLFSQIVLYFHSSLAVSQPPSCTKSISQNPVRQFTRLICLGERHKSLIFPTYLYDDNFNRKGISAHIHCSFSHPNQKKTRKI